MTAPAGNCKAHHLTSASDTPRSTTFRSCLSNEIKQALDQFHTDSGGRLWLPSHLRRLKEQSEIAQVLARNVVQYRARNALYSERSKPPHYLFKVSSRKQQLEGLADRQELELAEGREAL
jgi:hypothetical protein